MKHKDIRNLIIVAITALCFMVLTDRFGILFALLAALPTGFAVGMVSAYIDRWIGD